LLHWRDELGVDDAVRELIKSLPEVSAGFKRTAVPDELRPLFSSSSMGPRHIPALAYLLLTDGPMSVSQLAARLGVTIATASLMATQLADHGLIQRREDPRDRRRTLVSIAPGRNAVVQGWLDQRAEPIDALCSGSLAPSGRSWPERFAFLPRSSAPRQDLKMRGAAIAAARMARWCGPPTLHHRRASAEATGYRDPPRVTWKTAHWGAAAANSSGESLPTTPSRRKKLTPLGTSTGKARSTASFTPSSSTG